MGHMLLHLLQRVLFMFMAGFHVQFQAAWPPSMARQDFYCVGCCAGCVLQTVRVSSMLEQSMSTCQRMCACLQYRWAGACLYSRLSSSSFHRFLWQYKVLPCGRLVQGLSFTFRPCLLKFRLCSLCVASRQRCADTSIVPTQVYTHMPSQQLAVEHNYDQGLCQHGCNLLVFVLCSAPTSRSMRGAGVAAGRTSTTCLQLCWGWTQLMAAVLRMLPGWPCCVRCWQHTAATNPSKTMLATGASMWVRRQKVSWSG